jgi:hypothetical protein
MGDVKTVADAYEDAARVLDEVKTIGGAMAFDERVAWHQRSWQRTLRRAAEEARALAPDAPSVSERERDRALVLAGALHGEPTQEDPKYGNADALIAAVDRTHPRPAAPELDAVLGAYAALWKWAAASVVDGEEAAWIFTGQDAVTWEALRARGIAPDSPPARQPTAPSLSQAIAAERERCARECEARATSEAITADRHRAADEPTQWTRDRIVSAAHAERTLRDMAARIRALGPAPEVSDDALMRVAREGYAMGHREGSDGVSYTDDAEGIAARERDARAIVERAKSGGAR